MRYFLGIDIGGTKSHALIADETGRVVGFGQGAAGNWEVVGWTGTRRVLHDITHQAVTDAGIDLHQIAGAGFGLAGYDWPEDRQPHVDIIQSLGLQAPFEMGNDTLVGLVAGASQGWGVVVVAGTSNNALGRDRHGRIGRVIGSSRFAEYGGAGEIVEKAIEAVALAWTRRGPATQLTPTFIAATGARDEVDLLAGLTRNRYQLNAHHAPLVFGAAAAGDAVARKVIRWAGRELGGLACGIIRQLGLEAEAFEVVQAGSTYKGSPLLTDAMRRTIHAVAPRARLVRLQAPPVVGGVLLGMEQARLSPASLRANVIASTQAFLAQRSLVALPDPEEEK